MLTVFAFAVVVQQGTGLGVVWETPGELQPTMEQAVTMSDLSAWALDDPFGWERSQCSPLVRTEPSTDVCQVGVREALSSALGDRLPPGLRTSGEPVPCLAKPDADGAYPVRCGVESREAAEAVVPQEPICDTRPTRQGVVFPSECRPANARDERGGVSFKLFDRD